MREREGSIQYGSWRLEAEFLRRLVGRESGIIRRDFEEHTGGLAEVDRVEVGAIHDRADGVAIGYELAAHDLLCCVIRDTEGNVVH